MDGKQLKKKKTKEPERHLTFTKGTPYESKYLTHRVLPKQQVLFMLSKWWVFCMNSTVRTLSRLSLLTTLMPTQVVKVEWLQF